MGPQAQCVWDGLQFRTPAVLNIVERLTDEQLRWQPPNGANPVAWMLWHIPEVEDNWVRDRLYALPRRYPFGASVKSTPLHQFPTKAELLAYFHEVRTITKERLEQTPEGEFDRTVQDEYYGTISVRQVWAGVVTSAAWHGGQIVYVNRLLAR
jgi:uncharacterized damage-inducible protein DinB